MCIAIFYFIIFLIALLKGTHVAFNSSNRAGCREPASPSSENSETGLPAAAEPVVKTKMTKGKFPFPASAFVAFRAAPRAGTASSRAAAAGSPAGHSGRATCLGAAGSWGGSARACACAVEPAPLPLPVFFVFFFFNVSWAWGNP